MGVRNYRDRPFPLFPFPVSVSVIIEGQSGTETIIIMAKSVRSKRRQRVLSRRREKYRQVERKKFWEQKRVIEAEKEADMREGVYLTAAYLEWHVTWFPSS